MISTSARTGKSLENHALHLIASDYREFVLASYQKGHPGNDVVDAITWVVLGREMPKDRYPKIKPTETERQQIIAIRKKYLCYRFGGWRRQVARATASVLGDPKDE